MADPLVNPKDPMLKGGPDAQIELFRAFAQLCEGKPLEMAVDAAANIIINALRQQNPTWQKAEPAFDEIFGKMKSLLADHYDSLGRKRGIFAHPQSVVLPLVNEQTFFGAGIGHARKN